MEFACDSWDVRRIWEQFDEILNSNSKAAVEDTRFPDYCYDCDQFCVLYDRVIVCPGCGVVKAEDHHESQTFSGGSMGDAQHDAPAPKHAFKCTSKESRSICRMQEWYMWSKEEKSQYKVAQYIEEKCNQLCLPTNVCKHVVDMVGQVLKSCKDVEEGQKRSRVKDGIIVMCAFYVCKDSGIDRSYTEFAVKLGLDMKYITRADKLLLSLVHKGTLKFPVSVHTTLEPMQCIDAKLGVLNLRDHAHAIKRIIDISMDNDILIDNTPLSVGVGCLYYYVVTRGLLERVQMQVLCDTFGISAVTVTKTYNKMKKYRTLFD